MAYILTKGEIPSGLEVMHNCPGGDNRKCCNPNHLSLGTHAENLKDRDLKHPIPYQVKGEKVAKAKLTEQEVVRIRKFCKQGVSQRKIAKMFGVSNVTVFHIKKRVTWHHVA